MSTVTIPLERYNVLLKCEKQYNSLRELVDGFAGAATRVTAGGDKKAPKQRKMTRAQLNKHVEEKLNKIFPVNPNK